MSGTRITRKPASPDKCVEIAVKIIGDPTCRAKVAKIVWFSRLGLRVLGPAYQQQDENGAPPPTVKQKIAAERFAKTLRELETALGMLRRSGLKFTPLAEFPLTRQSAQRWREAAERMVATKIPTFNFRKHDAAEAAARLCKEYRIELKASSASSSKFCRLAAALYGFPDEPFYYHCNLVRKNGFSAAEEFVAV
jgi:hypothetical protein